MPTIEELRKLDQRLNNYLQAQRQKKAAEEDKIVLARLLGEQLQEAVTPVLNSFAEGSKATQEAIKTLNGQLEKQQSILQEGVKSMSEALSKVKIEVPEVKIPKIESPKLPQINVPESKVVVDTKNIEKTLREAIRGLKPPIVNVPKANIEVKSPKIPDLKWPKDKMPIEGWVNLMGVDLANPLPVQLRTPDGKPYVIGGSPVSGGRSGLSQKDSNYLKTISESQVNSPMAELYRISTTDSTVAYHGLALPGTLQTESKWRIRQIVSDSKDKYITWADGDSNFDNSWAERESKTYV